MCLFFCIVRYCMVIIDRARHSKRTSCRPSGVRLYYRIVTNRTACNLSLSAFHSLTISSSLPVLSSSSSLSSSILYLLLFVSLSLSPSPSPSPSPILLGIPPGIQSHPALCARLFLLPRSWWAKAFLFFLLPLSSFPLLPRNSPSRRSSGCQSLSLLSPILPPGSSSQRLASFDHPPIAFPRPLSGRGFVRSLLVGFLPGSVGSSKETGNCWMCG